jgi:hypothetical protein
LADGRAGPRRPRASSTRAGPAPCRLEPVSMLRPSGHISAIIITIIISTNIIILSASLEVYRTELHHDKQEESAAGSPEGATTRSPGAEAAAMSCRLLAGPAGCMDGRRQGWLANISPSSGRTDG